MPEDAPEDMGFDEYQRMTDNTANYPVLGFNYVYPAMGLSGEVGEVADKLKKITRDRGGIPSAEDLDGVAKELGDSLWYLARIATELGLSLSDVARGNIEKTTDRHERNTIQGSGDER